MQVLPSQQRGRRSAAVVAGLEAVALQLGLISDSHIAARAGNTADATQIAAVQVWKAVVDDVAKVVRKVLQHWHAFTVWDVISFMYKLQCGRVA